MSIDKKYIVAIVIALAIGVGAFFLHIDYAFPAIRCEGAHLDVPEEYADCVSCHAVTTPKITQDWLESKHGAMLVKCAVCHGDPTGEGSIKFAVNPDPLVICASCHDPAIKRMQAKFGAEPECNTCHPYHQNPMHSDSYETKKPTAKTAL